MNLYDRKILWITSTRTMGDEGGQINWDQITKNLEFQAQIRVLMQYAMKEILQVLNRENGMIRMVFLED